MRFVKLHGAGNDYVFVNCFDQSTSDPATLARVISDRHTGVGGDGLILICPSDVAIARMQMYNADGSRARMCGNGIRCVAKYLFDRGYTSETTFPIETDAGVRTAACTLKAGKVARVRIDMGRPRFAPSDIPVKLSGKEAIDAPIEVNGRRLRMTCVSMGNPHAVFFLDSLQALALPVDGPAVENHPLFPERVNAHFVEVLTRERVKVLTWERGSGATRACGTGACAVCAAGVRMGLTNRRIVAEVAGGELEPEWAEDGCVYLTGEAVEVFEGKWVGERHEGTEARRHEGEGERDEGS